VSTLNEATVQYGFAKHLEQFGWQFADDETLGRPLDGVFLIDDLEAAITRLNPEVAKKPERLTEVLAKLRAVLLGVRNDGLVSANEEFVQWMCGRRTIRYIGTDRDSQVRLIDFDKPQSNTLRVTTEATFHVGRERRRYDLVLWVNGLPLVVGEMKTPVGVQISWLNVAVMTWCCG